MNTDEELAEFEPRKSDPANGLAEIQERSTYFLHETHVDAFAQTTFDVAEEPENNSYRRCYSCLMEM